MSKKLSEETIKNIISEYCDGKTPTFLSQKYGIRDNSITRILRKNNIERNQHTPKISEENEKIIVQDYLAGKSSDIIASIYQINSSTISRILKRNGIAIRSTKYKYDIDQRYFQTIDTQEKAYWLGLLYWSESLISEKRYGIRLRLPQKDKDILEKFSNTIFGFIKIDKISDHTNSENGCHLYVNVPIKKIWQDLVHQGAAPRKTYIIKFPNEEIVPKHLLWHFIRGYFDSLDENNCIISTTITNQFINFSSSTLFIRGLIDVLEKEGIKCEEKQTNQNNTLYTNIQFTSPKQIKCFSSFYAIKVRDDKYTFSWRMNCLNCDRTPPTNCVKLLL